MYRAMFLLLIIISLFFFPRVQAKKRCKPLLDKLHNIQAMQRNGYSAKQGSSLRNREDKARANWWQCENASGKKSKQTKKKHQGKITKAKKKSTSTKSKYLSAGTPFKTSHAIVIKSKYQGEKKQAWLAYYQQPTKCQHPKNLPVFAFCSENKQTQRIVFEQKYHQGKRLDTN